MQKQDKLQYSESNAHASNLSFTLQCFLKDFTLLGTKVGKLIGSKKGEQDKK